MKVMELILRKVSQGSLVLLLSLSAGPATAAETTDTFALPPTTTLKVIPDTVRVRTIDGVQVCSLPRGSEVQAIGRDAENENLQVKINKPNCPATGFIDLRLLRTIPHAQQVAEDATVDESGLSLRSEPKVSTGTYKCSLDKGQKLDVLPEEHQGSTTTWFKVKLREPKVGCPDDGWVSASYLRPSFPLTALPVIKVDKNRVSEAVQCGDCDARAAEAKLARDTLRASGQKIEMAAPNAPAGLSPFMVELINMRKNRGRCSRQSSYTCHRGLIQMPFGGARNDGFCGSHQYSPGRPKGIDAYASPIAACNLVALAQEWKKTQCPERTGCTLSWGDISHKTRPRFNGHVSHTNGECVDIRPMRKGNFENAGLNYRSGDYDRQKTNVLIDLARSMGASTVIYNDPKIRTLRASGHANHIHICFGNNPKTRATCDNLQISPRICPELQ